MNYKDQDIQQKIQKSLNQLKIYNRNFTYNKITDHIIIFPYHVNPFHWNLCFISLIVKNETINNLEVGIYEPFGGLSAAEEKILMNIFDIQNKKTIKIDNIKQQNDASSCGAITAENGKEFLKRNGDGNNLL